MNIPCNVAGDIFLLGANPGDKILNVLKYSKAFEIYCIHANNTVYNRTF